MDYTIEYVSPLGVITLASDGTALLGLWFSGQKHYCTRLHMPCMDGSDLPVLQKTVRWLDAYWHGEAPSPIDIPLAPRGTAFQHKVWRLLADIPYGCCVTYGELARQYAETEGTSKMSAQAIGGAVGRNPISIIIPCHRVLGANGQMTGYDGGVWRKEALLRHEGWRQPQKK